MRGRLALWLRAQTNIGAFETTSDIWAFVLNTVLVVTALATAIYLVATAILANFGLLPPSLRSALGFGESTTILVAASVTALLAWLVGTAIHGVSLSRAEFERLSRLDALSGLLNRQAFVEALEAAEGDGFLVLFDVDRLKGGDDGDGSAVGDAVVVAVSTDLQRVFAPAHLVGRFGGKRFAVFIQNADHGDCRLLVEEARRSVATHHIDTGEGMISVKISAGIAERTTGRRFEAVFAAADRALGRDRAMHEDQSAKLPEPSRRLAAGGRRR